MLLHASHGRLVVQLRSIGSHVLQRDDPHVIEDVAAPDGAICAAIYCCTRLAHGDGHHAAGALTPQQTGRCRAKA